mmetsp:Transcript_1018/g.3083  ORF Transcript_1018/g.3083 Transcript_1018/m.3083 type:complete len:102 (+) Transcript_1018:280-585(+)
MWALLPLPYVGFAALVLKNMRGEDDDWQIHVCVSAASRGSTSLALCCPSLLVLLLGPQAMARIPTSLFQQHWSRLILFVRGGEHAQISYFFGSHLGQLQCA